MFSPQARFLRIGRSGDELVENRRGEVGIRADADAVLKALSGAGAAPEDPDREWLDGMRAETARRQARLTRSMREEAAGPDGGMHPMRLLSAVAATLDEDAIAVMDGGDILSFARVGLPAVPSLDCGALGCLGVGVPFAVAAALCRPERRVVAVIGDGAFGFSAMEVSTAVRHGARVLFLVANNGGWNIDRRDQLDRYEGHLVGVELPGCRYDLLARGLGAYGERVERAEELEAAIDRGLRNAPAVLDVAVTPEAVSPDYRNGLAEVPAWHALRRWNELELARRQGGDGVEDER